MGMGKCFIVLSLSAATAFAAPSDPKIAACLQTKVHNLLVVPLKNAAKSVGELKAEFDEMGPLRWLMKKPEPDVPSVAGGFFKEPPLPRNDKGLLHILEKTGNMATQGIPRAVTKKIYGKAYDFAPWYGINQQIRKGSKKFLNKDLQLSGFVTAGVDIAVLSVLYGAADAAEDKYRDEIARKHINGDYRFLYIKAAVKKSLEDKNKRAQKEGEPLQSYTSAQIDKLEIQSAIQLKKIYDDYYTYFSTKYASDLAVGESFVSKKLLETPLFKDIRDYPLAQEKKNRLIVLPEGMSELNDLQKEQLVWRRLKTLQEYALIPRLIHPEVGDRWLLRGGTAVNEVANQIEADPFYQKVSALQKTGKITQEKAIFMLMEDASWREKFDKWSYLGIQKQELDSKTGELLGRFLTLDDIRRETFEDLKL
jgi:hypothetical protein